MVDELVSGLISAKAVGNRLKLLRLSFDYTQDEMARLCGLNARSAWANYEKGYRIISRSAAYRLCLTIGGLTTDWIFGGRLDGMPKEFVARIKAQERKNSKQPKDGNAHDRAG